mgnify:CR=1 FL=1
MRKYLKFLFLTISIVTIYGFVNEPENNAVSLKVKVSGLRNDNGVVQFSLYNKNGSIPDEDYEKFYRMKTSKIENGSTSVLFSNLKQGVYAVNILHDENKNGKIDKGWVLPVEGIGFSNYESIGLTNRPNFSKASFEIKKNSTQSIQIIYM